MSNQTLLTSALKSSLVKQLYYSPVSQVQGINLTQFYCFLASVDPWTDDLHPNIPSSSQINTNKIRNNIFVVKNINSNQISPVIARIDWASGVVYNSYQDSVDMTQTTTTGVPVYQYYIKNSYDQVFKCLSNNFINSISTPSTTEPIFEPGTYNTNNIYQGIDGYKWKYIYTIDLSTKINFMDSLWIPVPISQYSANPTTNSSGSGDIEVINVINSGSGYDPANAAITVAVSGQSTATATATAVVNNGKLTDIIVTNTGSNYSYANVSITSTKGSGAAAIAPISPIGGHGSDPLFELGCNHIMFTSTFTGSETDVSGNVLIPTDIQYHQLGLMINPTTIGVSPTIASGAIYKTSTDLIVASGFGAYISDEIIYQGNSLATATFTATVLSFDSSSNIIKTINTTGTLNTNLPVYGVSSQTTRTLLNFSTPDFITTSGYIAYIENRSAIQRSSDGIEQFRIVLGL